jgi:hypothetical protein
LFGTKLELWQKLLHLYVLETEMHVSYTCVTYNSIRLKIDNYINDQNRKIWNDLSSKYTIELLYNPKEFSWKINTEDSHRKIITTPTKKVEIDSFTHELLHLYIDDLGMSTPKEILYSINGQQSFDILTKKGLFSIIHNFCSHKKMFYYYIEMGFSEDKFVSSPAKFGFFTYLSLKRKIKNNLEEGITDFIGNAIALFNNMGHKKAEYNSKKLAQLKKLSPNLFEIVEKFDQEWNDLENFNFLIPFKNFNNELEVWLEEN